MRHEPAEGIATLRRRNDDQLHLAGRLTPVHREPVTSETTYLLDAARLGDRQALDDLYARHAGRLLGFIRVSMSQPLAGRTSAEDILQETLLESARKIDSFEARGPFSFYRWLVEIARYKLSEARRAGRAKKRALETRLATDAQLGNSATPSRFAMADEGAARIEAALAKLPERQAEAVRLRYLGGLSLAETAERLESTQPAVKALVSRGLDALSRAMTAG